MYCGVLLAVRNPDEVGADGEAAEPVKTFIEVEDETADRTPLETGAVNVALYMPGVRGFAV